MFVLKVLDLSMSVCTSSHMLVNLFIKMNTLITKNIQVKFNSLSLKRCCGNKIMIRYDKDARFSKIPL